MNIEKHKCFVEANKAMAKDNTEIDFAYMILQQISLPVIRTCKVDHSKRGKPKILMASHCPFCGSSLQSEIQ